MSQSGWEGWVRDKTKRCQSCLERNSEIVSEVVTVLAIEVQSAGVGAFLRSMTYDEGEVPKHRIVVTRFP